MKLSAVNDCVIRFANVNGTGSASANNMFAKSIFRMGIPVTPKNIFPSNIQGLPTWYEVRVSHQGYLGRREGIDIMVCVNPQSMAKDVQSVKPDGYFIYDSTKPLHKEFIRPDIHYLGIPMTEMTMQHFSDPRGRLLYKNVIYVGALAALLDMDIEVIKGIISEQFKKNEKLIPNNYLALDLGYRYALEHFNCPLDIRLEKMDKVADSILMDGNTACGLGALYAGATVAAWYPITPSTSVVNAFEKYATKLRKDPETGENRFAVVQAEDELAAIGMVIGASWNGARAFTATSGPGVSLMSEFLGLAYFAEIPTVLIDVQRGGPSTGMPTRTQQSDLLIAAYASHGDTKQVLLFPNTPTECFELTAQAFDLAERLQTPVIVMTDLDLGMNEHLTAPLKWEDTRQYDRGKVYTAADLDRIEKYGRYRDVDGDGICYRTIPGTHPTKGAFFTRGTSRDEDAKYTEEAAPYVRNMDRLTKKWNTAKSVVPAPEFYGEKNSQEVGLVFFGTSAYAALEAMDMLAAEGLHMDAMRVRAFPFGAEVADFFDQHKKVFVIEQNRDAQFRSLLVNELELAPKDLIKVLNYDGFPITADAIAQQIRAHATIFQAIQPTK
jgi:2-oxoglutarate/2-oxoacid ferredoxin oxidoreductase subunit alpha